MKPRFWELALSVPSVKRFCENIAEDLIEGRNVIAVFPPGFDTDVIWKWIHAYLWRQNKSGEERDVSVQAPPNLAALASWLIKSDVAILSSTLPDLMSNGDRPDVINLNGLKTIPSSERLDWMGSIENWSRESQNRKPIGREWPRFLVLLHAGIIPLVDLPKNNVLLDTHWWWGFPSSAELLLLSRELSSDEDDEDAAWKECLISGIAPGDLTLADHFWSDIPKDYEGVVERLIIFGERFSENDDLSKGATNIRRGPRVGRGEELPFILFDDWEKGRIIGSYDFGIESHPVALAKSSLHEQLRYRMWRGQSQLLLPLINQVRLHACSQLTKQLGTEWFNQFPPPIGDGELDRLKASSLDAEFGYLRILAKRNPRVLELTNLRPEFIIATWDVRNDLSHYKPVNWTKFHNFYHQYLKG